jgi:hypothetical protein
MDGLHGTDVRFGSIAFFLDQKFRPQKVVLRLPSLTDRHTGENIAESVQNILEAFELGYQDQVAHSKQAQYAIARRQQQSLYCCLAESSIPKYLVFV